MSASGATFEQMLLDALPKHRQYLVACYAHELAEKVRHSSIEECGSGVKCCSTMVGMAADLIDPEVSNGE